jgi:hypothetical protein
MTSVTKTNLGYGTRSPATTIDELCKRIRRIEGGNRWFYPLDCRGEAMLVAKDERADAAIAIDLFSRGSTRIGQKISFDFKSEHHR